MAVIGSIREALRAGTYPATSAALSNVTKASVIANGSFDFIPYKNDWTNFEVTKARHMPTAMPMAISINNSRRTIRITAPRCAPRAIRMPISPVRRATS